MPEDNDEEKDDLPKVGGDPTKEVQNGILKAQKKKLQEEFKKAQNEVNAAADVLFLAMDKAEAVYAELSELKPVDFTALRKVFNH